MRVRPVLCWAGSVRGDVQTSAMRISELLVTFVNVCVLIIGLWSGRSARQSARAATEQLALTRDIQREAQQPRVWVDLRPTPFNPMGIFLVLGNGGGSAATDVRVRLLDNLEHEVPELTRRALERLDQGVQVLPVGREVHWLLGQGPNILVEDKSIPLRIEVEARGPWGPLATQLFSFDLADFRESSANASPELKSARALEKISKTMERLSR